MHRPTQRLFSTVTLSSVQQSIAGRSRFYKYVDVVPVEPTSSSSSSSSSARPLYKITLDRRNLRTPAGNQLHLPSLPLAMAVAAEWDAQQVGHPKGIQPATMPMMTLASTAIDQILPDSTQVKKTCLSYLPTDTALFFTTDDDRILLKKQKQHFQPVTRWMKRALRVELETTQGLSGKLMHGPEAVRRVEWLVDHLDHFTLACLQSATMECKSVVLALAFLNRHLTLDQAKAASRLEEEFQVEIWGVVEGGHDMDRLNNAVNLSAVGTFMNLLWGQKELDDVLKDLQERDPPHDAPIRYLVSPFKS
jgi:ATP synthase F1 complex assembly factor 2